MIFCGSVYFDSIWKNSSAGVSERGGSLLVVGSRDVGGSDGLVVGELFGDSDGDSPIHPVQRANTPTLPRNARRSIVSNSQYIT